MNILLILVIIIAAILALELFKHQITKNLFKYFVAIVVIIVIALIASAYIDFGEYIGKDSTFSKTGSVIVDGISDNTENIDTSNTFNSISDKANELYQKIIDN